MKWISVVLLLGMLLWPAPGAQAAAPALPGSPWDDPVVRTRIEPALLKQLAAARPEDRLPLVVTMTEQARPAAERAQLVQALQATAERSQRGLHGFLAGEQAAGRAGEVRPFWVFNGLALRAAPQTARALALRDDVALVRLDHYERRIEAGELANTTLDSTLPWGIQRIGADRVWAGFAVDGAGVVVANMDTGVDYQHPALNPNYRGNAGKGLYQHAGNWFDATPVSAAYPVDGHGHGTHTMGTIAGQGGTGVAPGARWIAVRVLDSQGYGYDSWIHAGFEWLLAPNGDPALAPDVVNASWGNTVAGNTEFQADVERLRAAGILTVFSAGNGGPRSATVGSPASLRGAFAVGATDSDDQVATFSSRGPSPWGEVKPQVVAPGVNVRSLAPGGSYVLMNGTSMAAPHVAGTAALMLSAHPGLTVTAIEQALTSTAIALDKQVPNNDTGWGRIDAYAAVQSVTNAGTIAGTLRSAEGGAPLAGANVSAYNYTTHTILSSTTDAEGGYAMGLATGVYSLTVSLFGYEPAQVPLLTVRAGETTRQDLVLAQLLQGRVQGRLTDVASGAPVTATVSVLGTPVSVQSAGSYDLGLPEGTYTLQVRGLGYRVVTSTVGITAGDTVEAHFALSRTLRVLLVNSGAWYYHEYPGYYRQALDDLHYAYDEWRIKNLVTDVPTEGLLRRYDAVLWSSPDDSPGFIGASGVITRYLRAGGNLLVSGQDVAFWDGGGSGIYYAPYLHTYLKTDYVGEEAALGAIAGRPGELMDGLSFRLGGGDGGDNQAEPDDITVASPDHAAGILSYGGGGLAGNRVGDCLPYRAVVLPFGYEGISARTDRVEVLRRSLDFFASPRRSEPALALAAASPVTAIAPAGNMISFTVRLRNSAEVGEPVTYAASLESAGWPGVLGPTQGSLAPCASTDLTLSLRVPEGMPAATHNTFTVSVRSLATPSLVQTITLVAGTPASVLLVDHDRWYDVRAAYAQPLQQLGIPYDTWASPTNGSGAPVDSPPAAQLAWYPTVVWFTGYDWFAPLTTYAEKQVMTYLDGGGRLLLSSAFYLDQGRDTVFARDYLGVANSSYALTATLAYGSPGDPLGTGLGPAVLINPFPSGGFPVENGVVEPQPAAHTAWRGDHDRAVAISARGPHGRTVFWGIPLESLPAADRLAAMGRALGWLGPLGDSTVQVEPAASNAGQTVAVSLGLRNNSAATRAVFTVTLPGGAAPLLPLPAGLAYDLGRNQVTGDQALAAGEAVTRTVPIRAGSENGQAPGSVAFQDQSTGLVFELPLALRVGKPDLALSWVEAEGGYSGQRARLTMVMRNTGTADAADATATGLAPLGVVTVPGSSSVEGPGTPELATGSGTWHGPLGMGQAVTVTFQITMPLTLKPLHLPVEMLAADGQGGAWEWRTWIDIRPYALRFPIVFR